MTIGTISAMSTQTEPGEIVTAGGSSVQFESDAVPAYEFVCLSVGRAVTFDLVGGIHPKAVNIRLEALRHAPTGKSPRPEDLRFVGFEQQGNTRAYHFEWLPTGEGRRTYLVTGNLALFTKHRVRIQEGPGLCLQLLMSHMESICVSGSGLPPLSLTDADMLSHLASRAEHGKSGPRRK